MVQPKSLCYVREDASSAMIELVTHCWSGDAVPIYHTLLQLQLSSLVVLPPHVDYRVTVCCSESDQRTGRVLEFFAGHLGDHLSVQTMDESDLFRRAIGRNRVALQTSADVVWFTDCDHLFLRGALDDAHRRSVASEWPLIWPATMRVHATHHYGDELISRYAEVDPQLVTDFELQRFRRIRPPLAIGGLQIVKGDYCREHGYMKDHRRLMSPVDGHGGFQKCRGDVVFRKSLPGCAAMPIDGVYRVRHSRCGRDQGTVDHSRTRR